MTKGNRSFRNMRQLFQGYQDFDVKQIIIDDQKLRLGAIFYFTGGKTKQNKTVPRLKEAWSNFFSFIISSIFRETVKAITINNQ